VIAKTLKFSIFVLLQVVLLYVIGIAVTADPIVIYADEMDFAQGGKIGYFLEEVHYSHEVLVEGEAEDTDLEVCISTIEKTLNVLPKDHVQALNKLTLVFDPEAKRGQAGGNIMKLRCEDISEIELSAVLIHEMGHITDIGGFQGSAAGSYEFVDGSRPVWSDDLSVEFYKISWISNDEWADGVAELDFVSGYAGSDPFEDFAESYAYYILQGDSFRVLASVNDVLAAKYEFLKEKVFDGFEYSGIGQYKELLLKRPYDVSLLNYHLEILRGVVVGYLGSD